MNKQGLLIGIVTAVLVALFAGGAFFYKKQQAEKAGFLARENAEVFVRGHSPAYGDENAPVYLVEYLDPECEACRAFHPFVKKLLADHPGKIRLVVRYAPFHGNSKFAIRILEAARMQGKYWQTLDVLFHYQPLWGDHHHPQPELIWDYLKEVDGLDIDKVRQDMNSAHIEKLIEQDVADMTTLEVRQTPTFFINGKPLQEFGFEQLEAAVKAEM